MSFIWTCLKNALRSQVSGWRTWVLLFLMPLLTFGVRLALPSEEAAAPVRVGVVLPESGGEEFWDRLERRGGLVAEFIPADEGQARRQVAAGRWDCALILPEDFESRLSRQDVYELFTLLVGPGSAAYPLVRESAAACVFELIGPGVARRYLLDSGIADEDTIGGMDPRLNRRLLDRERVLVSMETADGRALSPIALADSGVDGLLAGLTAVVLLVWALFTAMDLGRFLDSPFARRLLPLRGAPALLLPRMAGALAPALCSGALALLALDRPWAYIPALVPYLLFWGAAALVLCRRRALWGALPAVMPFAPVLALLFSPVLVDPSVLFPALAPAVRWAPVSLYLGACGGRWGDALVLAAAGLLLMGLSWLPDLGKSKRA